MVVLISSATRAGERLGRYEAATSAATKLIILTVLEATLSDERPEYFGSFFFNNSPLGPIKAPQLDDASCC